jgi:hypothetical protein
MNWDVYDFWIPQEQRGIRNISELGLDQWTLIAFEELFSCRLESSVQQELERYSFVNFPAIGFSIKTRLQAIKSNVRVDSLGHRLLPRLMLAHFVMIQSEVLEAEHHELELVYRQLMLIFASLFRLSSEEYPGKEKAIDMINDCMGLLYTTTAQGIADALSQVMPFVEDLDTFLGNAYQTRVAQMIIEGLLRNFLNWGFVDKFPASVWEEICLQVCSSRVHVAASATRVCAEFISYGGWDIPNYYFAHLQYFVNVLSALEHDQFSRDVINWVFDVLSTRFQYIFKLERNLMSMILNTLSTVLTCLDNGEELGKSLIQTASLWRYEDVKSSCVTSDDANLLYSLEAWSTFSNMLSVTSREIYWLCVESHASELLCKSLYIIFNEFITSYHVDLELFLRTLSGSTRIREKKTALIEAATASKGFVEELQHLIHASNLELHCTSIVFPLIKISSLILQDLIFVFEEKFEKTVVLDVEKASWTSIHSESNLLFSVHVLMVLLDSLTVEYHAFMSDLMPYSMFFLDCNGTQEIDFSFNLFDKISCSFCLKLCEHLMHSFNARKEYSIENIFDEKLDDSDASTSHELRRMMVSSTSDLESSKLSIPINCTESFLVACCSLKKLTRKLESIEQNYRSLLESVSNHPSFGFALQALEGDVHKNILCEDLRSFSSSIGKLTLKISREIIPELIRLLGEVIVKKELQDSIFCNLFLPDPFTGSVAVSALIESLERIMESVANVSKDKALLREVYVSTALEVSESLYTILSDPKWKRTLGVSPKEESIAIKSSIAQVQQFFSPVVDDAIVIKCFAPVFDLVSNFSLSTESVIHSCKQNSIPKTKAILILSMRTQDALAIKFLRELRTL